MRIHRRQFLKYCIGSAAALGLPMTVLGKLEVALAANTSTLPKVIWLNAANCTGCTISLSNLFSDSGPTDIVNRFYHLLRHGSISIVSQSTSLCPTYFDQINLSQLLIKPLELKGGASGSFKFSSMGI